MLNGPQSKPRIQLKMSQHKIVGHQYFNSDPNKWLILNEFISLILRSFSTLFSHLVRFKRMCSGVEHWTSVFQSPQFTMPSIEIASVLLKLTHGIKRIAWHLYILYFLFADKLMMAKLICARYKNQKQMILISVHALFHVGKPEIGNWILSFRLHSFHWEHSTEMYAEKCLLTWKLNAIDIQFVLLFILFTFLIIKWFTIWNQRLLNVADGQCRCY